MTPNIEVQGNFGEAVPPESVLISPENPVKGFLYSVVSKLLMKGCSVNYRPDISGLLQQSTVGALISSGQIKLPTKVIQILSEWSLYQFPLKIPMNLRGGKK